TVGMARRVLLTLAFGGAIVATLSSWTARLACPENPTISGFLHGETVPLGFLANDSSRFAAMAIETFGELRKYLDNILVSGTYTAAWLPSHSTPAMTGTASAVNAAITAVWGGIIGICVVAFALACRAEAPRRPSIRTMLMGAIGLGLLAE